MKPLDNINSSFSNRNLKFVDGWNECYKFAIIEFEHEVKQLKGTKEHICGFNDGEQSCECYNKAIDDVLSTIKQLRKEVKINF